MEADFQTLSLARKDDLVQPEQGLTNVLRCFDTEARRNGAQLERFANLSEATEWLINQAARLDTKPQLHLSPALKAANLDWNPLAPTDQTPEANHSWGLVKAHTAIAETGTILSLSTECPSSLLFLAERLIVIIDSTDVVAYQEDAWQRIDWAKPLPRTVNLVTGPSRTADIEQQIQIGAHGPKRTDYLILRESGQ